MSRSVAGLTDLLVRMFADTLGEAAIGARDEFFAFGGTSVQFIELLERLEKDGLAISLPDALVDPTAAGLAAAAARASTNREDQSGPGV